MSGTNILFGTTTNKTLLKEAFKTSAPQPVAVHFENNSTAQLQPDAPDAAFWAKTIDSLQRKNRPVYIEADAETGKITNLCIPQAALVWKIDETSPETIGISLHTSAVTHTLSRKNPGFAQMLELLQTALADTQTILITATPDYEILDVRPFPDALKKSFPSVTATASPEDIDLVLKPVSPQRALEIFSLMTQECCQPQHTDKTCIPFKFPQNGCWVRAHLMSYRMLDLGETPEKIICEGRKGRLRAYTSNSPKCEVFWDWHIAPTLLVTQPDGQAVPMVFDPSMSDQPISPTAWKNLQNNENATLRDVRWYQFNRFGGRATVDEANDEMDVFRDEYDKQCKDSGIPPYEWCPIQK